MKKDKWNIELHIYNLEYAQKSLKECLSRTAAVEVYTDSPELHLAMQTMNNIYYNLEIEKKKLKERLKNGK